jgi:predicted site-specific integrase-resolvase
MTNWMTEEEIVERFVIGERSLHRFSQHGMLPRRINAEGRVFFAEEFVSAMFRRRGTAMLVAVDANARPNRIGADTCLGEAPRTYEGVCEVAA